MVIKKLKLKNYRNYVDLDINLSDNLNIFIGDNAQGKSNILESIVVLALTKSYMNVKDKNLIRDGSTYTNIEALVELDNVVNNLFVSFDENMKKIKINNVEVKKYSDYISHVRFILFSPYDVGFVKDAPAVRRKYFDIEISQLSNKYVKILQNYNAILKKRNKFLKSIRESSKIDSFYFAVLNDKFSSLAVEITLERKKFIDSINKNLDDIYREISDYCGLNLKYNNSVDLIEDISQMKKMFIDKLNSSYEREKIYGMTLVGPHRDDYSLFLNEKNLAIYGSQGQNRLAVLALKLSEISIFKVITGDYPILLLDDVFSELDIQKRNKLIKYILDDVQTIITTTDLEIIDDILLKKSKIFKIVDGKVV